MSVTLNETYLTFLFNYYHFSVLTKMKQVNKQQLAHDGFIKYNKMGSVNPATARGRPEQHTSRKLLLTRELAGGRDTVYVRMCLACVYCFSFVYLLFRVLFFRNVTVYTLTFKCICHATARANRDKVNNKII